jgi:4-amino-4-deoxy-L-arabinose transferase-like glycosyltransferase
LGGYAPLFLAIAVYAVYLLVMFAYARTLFLFPFDYDQGEGFELYDAIRLARGENIYLDNAVFPYYSSNYPPVYRTLLVPLVLVFGPNIWVGRVLAFVFVLATGPLLYAAARRLMRQEHVETDGRIHVFIALLSALAYFAANYVYHVAPLARAHLPMVCIAVAGIFCLDKGLRDSPQPRWAGLGVALLITAGFTKLQAVDALAAGFAFLLLRHWRWGVIALAVSAVVTAVLVLLIDGTSGGQFLLNVVFANVNEYDIGQTWATYGQWLRLQGVLIVCSAVYVFWDLARAFRARSVRPVSIWSMYFVAGSALGMLTGKWGAGPTYLAAAIAASCVCTAGLIARIAQTRALRFVPIALLAALVFLAQSALNVHLSTSGRVFGVLARVIGVAAAPSSYPPYPYYDSVGYTQLGHLLDKQDTANGWLLVEELRKHPGPVWSEEAMLTLHAGKDVVTNPTQLLNLSKNNALDTRDMLARIRRREFGAVIYRAFFYPEDVKTVIAEHYAIVGSIKINGFDYYLLLPKP